MEVKGVVKMKLDEKRDIRQKFFSYALPSVAAMWVYTIYTMVDGMFVARGVGTTALARRQHRHALYQYRICSGHPICCRCKYQSLYP